MIARSPSVHPEELLKCLPGGSGPCISVTSCPGPLQYTHCREFGELVAHLSAREDLREQESGTGNNGCPGPAVARDLPCSVVCSMSEAVPSPSGLRNSKTSKAAALAS